MKTKFGIFSGGGFISEVLAALVFFAAIGFLMLYLGSVAGAG